MKLLKVLVFFDEISLGGDDVCFLPFCLIFHLCFWDTLVAAFVWFDCRCIQAHGELSGVSLLFVRKM